MNPIYGNYPICLKQISHGSFLALDDVGRLVAFEREIRVLAVVGQLAGEPRHGRQVVNAYPRHREVGVTRMAQCDDEAVGDDVAVPGEGHLLVQDGQLDAVRIGCLVLPVLDQNRQQKHRAVAVCYPRS